MSSRLWKDVIFLLSFQTILITGRLKSPTTVCGNDGRTYYYGVLRLAQMKLPALKILHLGPCATKNLSEILAAVNYSRIEDTVCTYDKMTYNLKQLKWVQLHNPFVQILHSGPCNDFETKSIRCIGCVHGLRPKHLMPISLGGGFKDGVPPEDLGKLGKSTGFDGICRPSKRPQPRTVQLKKMKGKKGKRWRSIKGRGLSKKGSGRGTMRRPISSDLSYTDYDTASYNFEDIMKLEDANRLRFIEYIDDNGTRHLIDTKRPRNVPYKGKASSQDVVKFLLFTKLNTVPLVLTTENMTALNSSNFNSNVSTVFIVHGWWSSANMGPNPIIKQAFLKQMDVNVIIVDWSKGGAQDSYDVSVEKVPDVGKTLTKLIMYLNETGASLDDMHLIGHSLGAHIVGNAGRSIGEMKVARITALDPAGPNWSGNPNRLKETDAKYVEAIHTNGGPLGLGTLKEWGSVNFYPNGGMNQPGCSLPTCSHSRSYELFASTVTHNHLIGRKCSNISAMVCSNCDGEMLPLGNSDLTKTGSGVYRVETGSTPPYNL